ncbi:MAG TPA: adenosylmethionine decarboxylase [Acidobacteriota bacterium]|nr:adenosylmethionine decarboxylase [Acidobacteriota bacterium]
MQVCPQAPTPKKQEALGRQVLIDLYGCPADLLDDVKRVENALVQAARSCGARVVETVLHRFSPQGVSGVVVIAESHLAVHTWPEQGYAALDVFTCGDVLSPQELTEALGTLFAAHNSRSRVIQRGLQPHAHAPSPRES